MSARLLRTVDSVLALLASAILGGVVSANAPSGQYAPFERGDHCISDRWTKLTWIRTPILDTATAAAAATTCAQLGADAGAASPWRVPSVNELQTLVDEAPHLELEGGQLLAKAIDANAFPGTPSGTTYRTSSVVPGGVNGWMVNFQDGSTTKAPLAEGGHPVRCVTEWKSATVPATCPF